MSIYKKVMQKQIDKALSFTVHGFFIINSYVIRFSCFVATIPEG